MLTRRALLTGALAAGVLEAVTPSRIAAAAGMPSFRVHPARVQALPLDHSTYALRRPLSPEVKAPFDDDGVSIYLYQGKAYEHPVKQAAYVINALESHRLRPDREYVTRSVRNGQRLIDTSVRAAGARYMVYRFPMHLHGRAALTVRPPRYSCMAQGQALSAFTRLYEATGERRWLGAAHEVFAGFRSIGVTTSRPWTTFVDTDGYLWFEEWPDRTRAGRAFNGHVFSLYGVYDYWRLTGDTTAERLARGGIASALHYAAVLRNPGWMSGYCLTHRVQDAKYHGVHTRQLDTLYALTRDPAFARLSDAFLRDYPGHKATGPGLLAPGRHTGLVLDADGRPTATRTLTLDRPTPVHVTDRGGVRRRPGAWLRIGEGPLAGTWVAESGRARLLATVDPHEWRPARRLVLEPGRHAGLTADADGGNRGATRVITLTRPGSVSADRRAVIDGRTRYRVASGTLRDTWVVADARARVV